MKRLRPDVTGIDIILITLMFAIRLNVFGVRSESISANQSNSIPLLQTPINYTRIDGISVNVQTEISETDYASYSSESVEDVKGGATDHPAGSVNEVWAKIRHLHQKVRHKETDQQEIDGHQTSQTQEWDYVEDATKPAAASGVDEEKKANVSVQMKKETTVVNSNPSSGKIRSGRMKANATGNAKPFRILASGTRKSKLQAVSSGSPTSNLVSPMVGKDDSSDVDTTKHQPQTEQMDIKDPIAKGNNKNYRQTIGPNPPMPMAPRSFLTSANSPETPTGAPKLENKIAAMKGLNDGHRMSDAEGESADEMYDSSDAEASNTNSLDDPSTYDPIIKPDLDIMTKFLRIVESQSLLGDNCTAGTDDTLGEGVVDRYAQDRFRLEAEVAVNRANWLTRLWKYAEKDVLDSEYLLHVNLYSMIEMDEDIFAAGNCYDKYQYKDYVLFCPFAYRMLEGPILAKDLAVEYKYLANTSEWFYIARKNAERVIRNMTSLTKAYHTYTANETAHTERFDDEILSVSYEDGKWSKPYFDCGGGNIWMMTYTVPFFGFANGSYFFKGTSGIDIDLRRVDIDQCPQKAGNSQLNIFAASDKCKSRTTKCEHIPGLGFRRGSYRCECRDGFYFPDTNAPVRFYNGTVIEEEYEKKLMGLDGVYDQEGKFECLPCPEGCDVCVDDSPCIVTLNWVMRTTILILEIIVICCLPVVALFTWRYSHVKVVRAASPALLRLIILGAFFIYCTILVAYMRPNMITCSLRVWFREIGFSFAYGALMLKTWRISVIFRVRSAKAIKITDLDLIKRLGIIVSIFAVFLSIRTVVGPPHVIVAKTADDLKAYICETDWWDHVFTAMEMVVLVWGIRLCIVVRKAPSEFNESRFISMAIYNEFLLSIFLNVSMLFLQSPANPDLMYIIMFSHAQLTTTLLLVLIFASKAYLALRGRGKEDASSMANKPQAAKFLAKPKSANHSNVTPSGGSFRTDVMPELSSVNDPDIQAEIRRLLCELDQLKEKTARYGHTQFAARLTAMSQAARQVISPVAPTEVIAVLDAIDTTAASNCLENGPSTDHRVKESDVDLRQRKTGHSVKEKIKSPKNSPDSGLGGLMFNSGPVVNNVLACMTDRIVCATFSADPSAMVEDDEDVKDAQSPSRSIKQSKKARAAPPVVDQPESPSSTVPASSLALAAAPLLSSNFAFDSRGVSVLRNFSAPNSRRTSSEQTDISTSMNAQLSLVGDHTNSGALFHGDQSNNPVSVQSLCQLLNEQANPVHANHEKERRYSETRTSPCGQANSRWPLSPKVKSKLTDETSSLDCVEEVNVPVVSSQQYEMDSSVRSAQITPVSTPGRSLSSSRSRINTDDRERFTEEVTV
ncbi:LOW QUALITY PROTEIN: probable G-protein coupled receptor 158 [Daphnia magna]|uniref:LOW QUALITY PROTEIN: probable G-protein coupled receptor 158 n=1 Tax=Daphnia magna TaxID=35525 RepID=UPI001E1BCA42|nr:LOW QUALITY PROTEIN: probable G-protein coupled receptor 158 [Daphnia magna]